jgi:mannitol/fructose-specific phosphotransferase system IIA component (Ntr-type)
MQEQSARPIGIVHLKDMFLMDEAVPDLLRLARPIITVREESMLETLLTEMQRRRIHAAIVIGQQSRWTGFLTLEDVIEEIVGTIRDEFEDEEHFHLADAIQANRIHLGVEAETPIAAVRIALERMGPNAMPIGQEAVLRALDERERVVGTYLGRNLGMPHARIVGLQRPIVMMIRSENGIPYVGTNERAHLLFVLLTPAGQPRVHQRLQAVIATIMDESEYIPERLRTAQTPEEVLEILRAGEQATLD